MYVTFEDSKSPAWVTQNTNIQTVRGLKSLEERLAKSPHGPMGDFWPFSAILKDIQGLALSKYAVFQVFLTSSEPQTSLVIIRVTFTPVFREPSLDPIHFLGSVLSLQRTAYYPRRLLTAF